MESATLSASVTVTEAAAKEIAAFMGQQENQGKSVRLFVDGFACSGPHWALALDEPNQEETVYSAPGVVLIADKETQDMISEGGGLTINYVNDPNFGEGFSILANNARSCGSGCSCGG